MGVKQVPTDELVTNDAKEEWKTFMQYHKTVEVLFRDRYFSIFFNFNFIGISKNFYEKGMFKKFSIFKRK